MRPTLRYRCAISLLTLFALQLQARELIFTPDAAAVAGNAPGAQCLLYHGSYNGISVLSTSEHCNPDFVSSLSIGRMIPKALIAQLLNVDEAAYELLHVQEARSERSNGLPATSSSLDDKISLHARSLLSNARLTDGATPEAKQYIFTPSPVGQDLQALTSLLGRVEKPLHLHDTSESSGIYAIPRNLAHIADMLFPKEAVLVLIPSHDLPLSNAANSNLADAPQWLNSTLCNLQFNPLIDAIIDDIEPHELRKDVRHLTGEDGKSAWVSRHSFTSGARLAASWIKETIEGYTGANCESYEHNEGFSPDVICTFEGYEKPEEIIIMGAHYDSRGTFGHVRAPGGNDDASGTSILLSLAKLFKAYNIRFKRTVQLVFFSGEEQGLWGSRAYAKRLRDENVNVRFMLQADEVGYHAPGEPMQIALPDKYDTIEARWLVGNLSHIYQPALQVGTTPACCSDHQSFDQQGFVSTWVFERNGPIADPRYHNSEDVSDREGYDFEQIAAIGKVMFATVLTVAEFTL